MPLYQFAPYYQPNQLYQSPTVFSSLQNYFNNLIPASFNFLLNLLAALLIFFVGWLVAAVVRWIIEYILKNINLREILQKANLDKYFENFVWEERIDRVIAEVVFWVIILVFLMTTFDVLGLQVISSFIGQVVSYIPKALAGGLILAFGFLFGELARKVLVGIFHGLEKKSANAVSSFVKWAVVIFSFLAALSQWGVASDVVNTFVMGLVFFVALAGGLAFGLGGQELAREFLENFKRQFK